MIIVTSATIIALAWTIFDLHKRSLALHHRAAISEAALNRALLRLEAAHILPDKEGHFRLHVPVSFSDGMADGVTKFVPILHDEPVVHMHKVTGEGVIEHTYELKDQPDGTISARPVPAS